MKNNLTIEIIIAVVLVLISIALINPFHFWMPGMIVLSMLVALLVVFGVFATFVLRETALDEREASHRMLAGRVGFLTGATVLIIGIVIQALAEAVDVWLIFTLVLMVVAKIGTRIYTDNSR